MAVRYVNIHNINYVRVEFGKKHIFFNQALIPESPQGGLAKGVHTHFISNAPLNVNYQIKLQEEGRRGLMDSALSW